VRFAIMPEETSSTTADTYTCVHSPQCHVFTLIACGPRFYDACSDD
jgi:hypothetical protein